MSEACSGGNLCAGVLGRHEYLYLDTGGVDLGVGRIFLNAIDSEVTAMCEVCFSQIHTELRPFPLFNHQAEPEVEIRNYLDI